MQASKDSRKWYFLFLVCFVFGATMLAAADKHVDLLSKKITLDVEDGHLSHILSSIAKMSDCNIVLAVERKGEDDKKSKLEQNKITIHLNEVPIEQALSLVVKAAGLSYRIVGESTFLVGDKERINEEVGERSYVINLNYIDAEKVTKALDILPGKAVEITGQNSILLRANPETFAEISTRIEELDVPQKQIEIRARIIEISIKDSKKLGIDWSRLNHLTTIIAEDPSAANGVGLPYSYGATDDGLTHGEPTDFAKLPDEQYFQMMDDWDNSFHFSRQLTAFDITVDWLLQNNAAKILTDTRITALNGELANIHIGEVVPFVVTDKEYEISVEREEVGIKLEVQPKVNKDGQITTTIAPEVSSVAELVGGYVPRVKKRTVKSTITVPDGSKIIVGGLLNSELVNTENRVPFFSSLPFVGKFFKHYVEEIYTTDLVIEITPRVVDVEVEQVEYEVDSRLNRPLIKEMN